MERKIIYQLICSIASLYVRFLPLSIAPVDPCALSFSPVFSPTCSHSLVPPSFLFHVPSATEAAAGQSLGQRGKVGLREGRSVAQLGRDYIIIMPPFVPRQNSNYTSAAKPNSSVSFTSPYLLFCIELDNKTITLSQYNFLKQQ